MLNKEFGELYEEERVFVLRHLSSAEEYNHMREVLLSVQEAQREEEISGPDDSLRERLLKEFREKRRSPFSLNSLMALLPSADTFRMPAVRYAMAAITLVLGISIFYYLNKPKQEPLPIVKQEAPKVQPAPAPGNDSSVSQLVPQMVVEQKVKSIPPPDSIKKQQPPLLIVNVEPVRKGITMEDEKELEGLLYTAL